MAIKKEKLSPLKFRWVGRQRTYEWNGCEKKVNFNNGILTTLSLESQWIDVHFPFVNWRGSKQMKLLTIAEKKGIKTTNWSGHDTQQHHRNPNKRYRVNFLSNYIKLWGVFSLCLHQTRFKSLRKGFFRKLKMFFQHLLSEWTRKN